jgi:hypothetical protein
MVKALMSLPKKLLLAFASVGFTFICVAIVVLLLSLLMAKSTLRGLVVIIYGI